MILKILYEIDAKPSAFRYDPRLHDRDVLECELSVWAAQYGAAQESVVRAVRDVVDEGFALRDVHLGLTFQSGDIEGKTVVTVRITKRGREWYEAPTPCVVLYGPTEPPRVFDRIKKRLTAREYDVLKVLVDNHPTRFGMNQLDRSSGRSDVHKALAELRKKDEDWARAIQMAGIAGRGYGLTDMCVH